MVFLRWKEVIDNQENAALWYDACDKAVELLKTGKAVRLGKAFLFNFKRGKPKVLAEDSLVFSIDRKWATENAGKPELMQEKTQATQPGKVWDVEVPVDVMECLEVVGSPGAWEIKFRGLGKLTKPMDFEFDPEVGMGELNFDESESE